jgi:4-carboxymuconolactone decarboxylase
MARISYLDAEDLPSEYCDLLTTHLEISLPDMDAYDTVQDRNVAGGARNIYRLFAHEPAVLRSHREHLSLMWEEFDLAPRDREIVLLVAARALEAEYEWHHHVPVALDEGLTPDELRAIADRDHDGFTEKEQVLAAYAEAFVAYDVTDDVHDPVAEFYDDRQLLDLAVLLGFYVHIASTVMALGIELEESFVGWDLAGI